MVFSFKWSRVILPTSQRKETDVSGIRNYYYYYFVDVVVDDNDDYDDNDDDDIHTILTKKDSTHFSAKKIP